MSRNKLSVGFLVIIAFLSNFLPLKPIYSFGIYNSILIYIVFFRLTEGYLKALKDDRRCHGGGGTFTAVYFFLFPMLIANIIILLINPIGFMNIFNSNQENIVFINLYVVILVFTLIKGIVITRKVSKWVEKEYKNKLILTEDD